MYDHTIVILHILSNLMNGTNETVLDEMCVTYDYNIMAHMTCMCLRVVSVNCRIILLQWYFSTHVLGLYSCTCTVYVDDSEDSYMYTAICKLSFGSACV